MITKYLNLFNNVPKEQRTQGDSTAVSLAQNLVDKFELEKNNNNKTIQDIKQGDILKDEIRAVNNYNNDKNSSQHIDILGNSRHNTVMAQFIEQDGAVADQIVSSNTPHIRDRDLYYDEFSRLGVTNTQSGTSSFIGSNSSSPAPAEEDKLNSPDGNIISSPAPAEEDKLNSPTGNILSSPDEGVPSPAYNPLAPINTLDQPAIKASSSSSSESAVSPKETASGSKRKRDEDDDDRGEGPSKHTKTFDDTAGDHVSSIYDLAGDD